MYHSHLQQRLSGVIYAAAHTASGVCKYASVCMRFTVHHIAWPPHPNIRPCLCVPGGILSDRCLLPDAK